MSLDFAPKPGAAPLPSMILSQAVMELRLLLRNGEQLLLALVIPLLMLVAGAKSSSVVDLGSGRAIDIVTPGVLALAVLSTSFTSLAIATGFERRYGVLKRLGASPLPRSGLLAGKIGAVLIIELLQLFVLSAVAFALGWQPESLAAGFGWLLVLTLLATAAFGSLGLLIAGALRAEATLAVANVVYALLLVGGAVLVPLDRYPASLHGVIQLLPSTALGEGLRDAFAGVAPAPIVFLVLTAWAVAAAVATARTFTWE